MARRSSQKGNFTPFAGPRLKLPRFLDDVELARLIEVAEASSPRDHALVVLLAYTGLRISEACRLTWGDVYPDYLFVREGKGGRDRYVPLHSRVAEALARLRIPYATRNDFVFSSPRGRGSPITSRAAQYVVERLCLLAEIPREKAHPHTLRHTFAVRLLESGTDLRSIQMLLGHAGITTTTIYLQLSTKHLRSAVSSLS